MNYYHKLLLALVFVGFSIKINAQIPFSLGSIENEQAADIDKDIDQNIYVAYTISATTLIGSTNYATKGKQDIIFAKYSPLGAYQWHIGLGSTENDKINALKVDGEGNVYIGGYISAKMDIDPSSQTKELTTSGKKDAFIAKYSKTGALLWGFALGAADDDEIFDIELDGRGGVYVTGRFQQEIDFNPSTAIFRVKSKGKNDWFLLKLNEDGTFQWVNGIGGTEDDWAEGMGAGLAIEPTGNCYLYATFRGFVNFNPRGQSISMTNTDSLNAFVGKYRTDGLLTWVNRMQSKTTSIVSAGGITLDYANDVIFTGTFEGSLDADPTNAQFLLNSRGKKDIFLIKCDPNGKTKWAVSGGGFDDDGGVQVRTSLQGSISLIGWVGSNAEFRTGSNVVNFTSQSIANTKTAFLANFDNFGAIRWGKSFGKNNTTSQQVLPQAICVDGQENSIFTGIFYDSLRVSPQNILNSRGKADIFVIKIDKNGEAYVTKNCSGKPSAGEVLGDSSICTGQVSRLKLFKPTEAIGLQIQWQLSTDNKNFVNMGNSTNSTEIVSNEIFKTSYVRAIMICQDSKVADTSKVRRILVSDLEINVGANQTIKVGDMVILGGNPVAQKGVGKYKYSWTPRSILENPTSANPTFRPLLEGDYTFTVSVSDSICSTQQSVRILVNPVLGLEAQKAAYKLVAFPNPAQSSLEIRYFLQKSGFTQISLLNLQGQTLQTWQSFQTAGQQNKVFEVKNLPEGLYFYRFQTEEGFFTDKFLINRP